MDVQWNFTEHDIHVVKDLIRKHRKDVFVVRRINRNLQGERPPLTPTNCWHTLMLCLMTTQQRSGPDSPVKRFLSSRPFELKLSSVKKNRNTSKFVTKTLQRHGGIRLVNTIGSRAAENLSWFSRPRWPELKDRLSSLEYSRGYSPERKTANWLASEFSGLGPKQSRNFLQCLGLTRHEIPIDSRITKWLNEFGFPVTLSASALGDPHYYDFVSDGVRELCKAAGIYSCIFDAVVFSMVDKGGWERRKIVF